MREGPMEDPVGVGIRAGGDRRQKDRRGASRNGADRRRGDRRRKAGAAGGLVVSALSLGGLLYQGRPADLGIARTPTTTTQVIPPSEPQAPVAPDRKYDDLIAEASAEYGVDPDLVRAVI